MLNFHKKHYKKVQISWFFDKQRYIRFIFWHDKMPEFSTLSTSQKFPIHESMSKPLTGTVCWSLLSFLSQDLVFFLNSINFHYHSVVVILFHYRKFSLICWQFTISFRRHFCAKPCNIRLRVDTIQSEI